MWSVFVVFIGIFAWIIHFDHAAQKDPLRFNSIPWVRISTHIISIDASVKYRIFVFVVVILFEHLMVFMVKRETCNLIFVICLYVVVFSEKEITTTKNAHTNLVSHIKNPNAITDGENGLYRNFFFASHIIVHGSF